MKSKVQSVKEVIASLNIDNLRVTPNVIIKVLKEDTKTQGQTERKRTKHNGSKIQ